MSADEFIEQYGPMELLKMMKMSGDPEFENARKSIAHTGAGGNANARRSGSNPRASNVAGMAEMKAKMANDILNAKAYEETPRNTNSIGGQRAGSPGTNARKTKVVSSPKGAR